MENTDMEKSLNRRLFEGISHLFVAPLLAIWLQRMCPQPKILLVLSHARSGSTLLQHILCSHPKILGFGENKISYTSNNSLEAHLAKLVARTTLMLRSFRLHERYFVDKLVWNYEVSRELLHSERCRFIFLLRAPEPTIASMERRRQTWKTKEIACQYYTERLSYLEDIAQNINSPDRAFFLTYKQITAHTSLTLGALQKFLGLDEPLTERYDLLPTTGRWGFGDKSANISAGKIVAPASASTHLTRVSDKVQQTHAQCETVFRARCATV